MNGPAIGQLTRFWVVEKPRPLSAMEDVCWSCTLEKLALQVRGGLDLRGVAFFLDEASAKDAAARLLAARDLWASLVDPVSAGILDAPESRP